MTKKKNKPRHRVKGGIMGRSDIPLAERIRLDQLEKINANRERAVKAVLYAYSIAMHELEGFGYKRLIRFAQVYRELEDEFYEDPEVGMEHVKQRLMEMGMEISGQWLKAPSGGAHPEGTGSPGQHHERRAGCPDRGCRGHER